MGDFGGKACALVAALALASCAAADKPTRFPLALADSVVSFQGDETRVTARYRYIPPGNNLLNREQILLRDVVIEYTELSPGWFYTRGGRDTEARDLARSWQEFPERLNRGLEIALEDVREGENGHGAYYYAVTRGGGVECAYARQVFGLNSAEGIVATGSQRLYAIGCRQQSFGKDFNADISDIMSRIRVDDGTTNRAKALSRPTTASKPGAPSNLQRGGLRVAWEGHDTDSGIMEFENRKGRGRLTVWLKDQQAPCTGSWILARGSYDSSVLPQGVWALTCPSGISASGEYRSFKPGQASGMGTDSDGRKISFTYDS